MKSINGAVVCESLERALDYAIEGMFLVNTVDQIIYCNARLEHLTGLEAEQVIGESFRSLFDHLQNLSRDPDRTRQELDVALQGLDHQPVIYLSIRYPLVGHLQITFFPIGDGAPYADGWGGIVRDVSNEQADINQRTEYLSALVNEMRESLAKIGGLVATLQKGHNDWEADERQYFIASIVANTKQLERLFENEQELFKLQTDEIRLERKSAHIQPLIRRATQQVSHDLGHLAISHYFSIVAPDDLPPIEIDTRKVEHILQNILMSVIKHTLPGSTIQIAARAGRDSIVISVGNYTRPGTVENVISSISASAVGNGETDRFLYSARELLIASYLTHAHGGHMWIDTAAQDGTVICCAFPLMAPVVEKPAPPPSVPIRKDVVRHNTRSRQAFVRALVVDDDPQIQAYLRTILEDGGYYVVTAESGRRALELASIKKPNIVLLDMRLPDIDGLTVCTSLREVLSAPIIMVTANSRPEETIRALDGGADDYLTKPVEPKELLARIRANLRRGSSSEHDNDAPPIHIGDLRIDMSQRSVKVADKMLKLTPTEFNLLYVLAKNAGLILTHSQILSAVWGPQYEDGIENLWVHINHLRRKIETDPANPRYIVTEPSIGYYMPAQTEDVT